MITLYNSLFILSITFTLYVSHISYADFSWISQMDSDPHLFNQVGFYEVYV